MLNDYDVKVALLFVLSSILLKINKKTFKNIFSHLFARLLCSTYICHNKTYLPIGVDVEKNLKVMEKKVIYFGDVQCKQYDGVAKLSADGSYWIFRSLSGDYIHTNCHELSFI